MLKLEESYMLNRDIFEPTPFDDWTDKQLNEYIRKHTEKEFKEYNITCIDEAVKRYENLYSNGAITQQDKVIFVETSRAYFNGELG